MAERYTRLFALTEDLYQSGAPVLIAAGALLKDNQTNRALAQIKLQSLSDKPIKAAKVTITPLDVIGNKLGSLIEHQYLDLNIQRDEAFGAKSPIALPDATTRAFRAAVTSVVFVDNTVWSASDAAWEPIPAPVTLEKAYPDAELRKQFKLEFGAQSRYIYAEFADLCLCPCGALNRQEEAKCHTCGCDLTALRELDIGELEKHKDERLEQERIAEEERQERERIAKEKAAVKAAERTKKAKKIAKIAAPFVCILIAFLIVLNTVIIPSNRYNKAVALAKSGEKAEAAILFGSLGDYLNSRKWSASLWNSVTERQAIAAGLVHTVGLKSDGTVVAVGHNKRGQLDVSDWTDIVAVAAGGWHTVGLQSDGTIVVCGSNEYSQCDVSGWRDIVAVAAGQVHTVGLKSDGTVVAVGSNMYGQCDVSKWTDIVAIAAGNFQTVGLKMDGTVVAVGDSEYSQCDVEEWTDIVAIAADDNYTAGLKSDGAVVVVGANIFGRHDIHNIKDWTTDIATVSDGSYYTVRLKSDGTVVAVGINDCGQCDVDYWSDIKLP